MIEHHKLQMRQEKEKHAAHVRQLGNEMENLKELLHTYEISIGRKDEVVIQFHNSTVSLFLKISTLNFWTYLLEQNSSSCRK